MTSNPSTRIAVLKRFTWVAVVGFASATLLAACAGSPLPSLAGADAGLMTAPETAEMRPEATVIPTLWVFVRSARQCLVSRHS